MASADINGKCGDRDYLFRLIDRNLDNINNIVGSANKDYSIDDVKSMSIEMIIALLNTKNQQIRDLCDACATGTKFCRFVVDLCTQNDCNKSKQD